MSEPIFSSLTGKGCNFGYCTCYWQWHSDPNVVQTPEWWYVDGCADYGCWSSQALYDNWMADPVNYPPDCISCDPPSQNGNYDEETVQTPCYH